MAVYQIQSDCEEWIVEAPTMGKAIDIWTRRMKHEAEQDFAEDFNDEPDSCFLLSERDVVREPVETEDD